MKKLLFILLLAVVSSQAFGQKKGKSDPKDYTIDSLKTANTSLNVRLDSMTKEKEVYYGMYMVIRDEIVKKDFDPSKTKFLIDSLKSTRDANTLLLSNSSTSLGDSLKIMKEENLKLKTELASAATGTVDTEKLEKELMQLKGLLDKKIISQEEFEAKKKIVMEKWK